MLEIFLYRECKECGTPRIVSRMYRWGNNGNMGVKFRDEIRREVFLNASIYDDLVDEVNRKIGIPVWHIVYESSRNAGRGQLEDLYESNKLLRRAFNFKPLVGTILRFYHELFAVKGFGTSKMKEIKSLEKGSTIVRNPFNLQVIAGTIASAMEAGTRQPYNCTWEKMSDNEYLFTAVQTDEKPDISERLEIEPPELTEGNLKLRRCSKCNTPKRVSELFKWNREEGIITHRVSNARFCSFVSNTFPPLFRELAEELGDEIYDFLVTTQAEWTVSHLDKLGITAGSSDRSPEEAKEAFEEYLKDFPIYGYGNPVDLKESGGRYLISIENPFYTEMVAGILLGLYKGLLKKDAQVKWESTAKGRVDYKIESA